MSEATTQGPDDANTKMAALALTFDQNQLFDAVAQVGDGGETLGRRIVGVMLAGGQASFREDLGLAFYGVSVAAAPATPPGVPDSVREAFKAADLHECWVNGDTADVMTNPYPGCGNFNQIVARCATGDLWRKRAVAIAESLNFVRALNASHPAGQSAGSGAEPAALDWVRRAADAIPSARDSTRTGDEGTEEREAIAREVFGAWFLAETASHDGHEEEALLAWKAGTDFPDAFTLAYAAADRIIAARPAALEAQGASRTLAMSYHLMCEEERRLHTVMGSAATWHDDQAKALSKQPPGGGRDWQRLEHEEQARFLREDRPTPPSDPTPSGQGGR